MDYQDAAGMWMKIVDLEGYLAIAQCGTSLLQSIEFVFQGLLLQAY